MRSDKKDVSAFELSLADALERWSDPDAWREFLSLEKSKRLVDGLLELQRRGVSGQEELDILAREMPFADRAVASFRRLERTFREQLAQGLFVASGYEFPRKLRSKRQPIPAELWRRLRINFNSSNAVGDGLRFVDVVVSKAGTAKRELGFARVSPTVLSKWYEQYVKDCIARNLAPSRELDVVAARAEFGDGAVTERMVRDLRRKLAPKEWSQKGRRIKVI